MWAVYSLDVTNSQRVILWTFWLIGNLIYQIMFIPLRGMYAEEVFNLLISCLLCLFLFIRTVLTSWHQWPEITLMYKALQWKLIPLSSVHIDIWIEMFKNFQFNLIDYLTFTHALILISFWNTIKIHIFIYSKIIFIWNSTDKMNFGSIINILLDSQLIFVFRLSTVKWVRT